MSNKKRSNPPTKKIGRSAKTGRFISIGKAKKGGTGKTLKEAGSGKPTRRKK
jgi:hypothetical protein